MGLVSTIFYFFVFLLITIILVSLFLVFTYSLVFILLVLATIFVLFMFIRKGAMVIYPTIELFARVFKFDVDAIKRDFISYSNNSISRNLNRNPINASQILVLLPHCIQNSDCLYKVTWDKLENCRLCGKCCVPQFLELKRTYGIDVAVVSGGTAARELVRQKHPKAVIAVACENDLISGLRDVRGIPVFAVLNQRPCGPCKDTTVDVEAVRSYIQKLTGGL